jgi:pimeloyl-ACP methyl ester carboxylesterase
MALWGEFAGRLADEFRVIAFDPRGVGRSSDPPLLTSIRDMAADAAVLLEQLGVSQAHVFGLSLGGMVASCLAIDWPERVGRLILASTLPEPSTVSRRLFKHVPAMFFRLARSGRNAEVSLVRDVLSPEFQAAHPGRMREIDETVRAFPAKLRNLAILSIAAVRHCPERDLRRVRSDALVLFGSLDPIAGQAARREWAKLLSSARTEILQGAGHDLSLEQPEQLARRVIAFLRE